MSKHLCVMVCAGLCLTTQAAFDQLQNQVHRANLRRDGLWTTAGVTSAPHQRWRFQTAGPVRSSPVVVGQVVYVGSCDSNVYAISATNGALVWKHKTGGIVSGAAAVVSNTVYIQSEDGYLYALGVANGTQIWRAATGGKPSGAPMLLNGVVYAPAGTSAGHRELTMTGVDLFGFNAQNGSQVWNVDANTQGFAAPATDGTNIYISYNGGWRGYSIATAAQVWQRAGGNQNRQFMAMAVATNGLVVAAGTTRGDVNALLPTTGAIRWRGATAALNLTVNMNSGGDFGYATVSDVALAQGRVFVGCNDGGLYAFRFSNGSNDWSYATGGAVMSSPSVAGELVYFGSMDGYLRAVNAVSGMLVWQWQCGPALTHSSPWPGDGVVFVGSEDGAVYAIEGATNRLPTAQILSATPASGGPPPIVVTLCALAVAGESAISNCQWHFGDSSAPTNGPALTNVVHTYTVNGAYTAMFTVADNLGASAFDTSIITVMPEARGVILAVCSALPCLLQRRRTPDGFTARPAP